MLESPKLFSFFFVYCDVFSLEEVGKEKLLDVKLNFLKMSDRVVNHFVHKGVEKGKAADGFLNISIKVEGEELKADKFRDILESFIDVSLKTRKLLKNVSQRSIIYLGH